MSLWNEESQPDESSESADPEVERAGDPSPEASSFLSQEESPRAPGPDPDAPFGADRIFDLRYRPSAVGWPAPYCVQFHHQGSFLSVYGRTLEDVIENAKDKLVELAD